MSAWVTVSRLAVRYMRLLGIVLWLVSAPAIATTYLAAEDFIDQSFEGSPQAATLWLTQAHQDKALAILGHPYRGLRLRYWSRGERSLWILDEVGKEEPITVGVVVQAGVVARVAILAFRESRGWEVRHPFFTRQFERLMLDSDLQLTGSIDGITGATLSVKAVTNVTRFALYLHESVTVGEGVAMGAIEDD
jgi:hypothetical protein